MRNKDREEVTVEGYGLLFLENTGYSNRVFNQANALLFCGRNSTEVDAFVLGFREGIRSAREGKISGGE